MNIQISSRSVSKSDCEEMMEKFGKDLTPHRVKYRQLKR